MVKMDFAHIVDCLVVLASVLICVLISVVVKRSEKKTVDGFLLGDRQMSVVPVAISSFATVFSANSITTTVGESFTNGFQFFIMPFSFYLMQIPIAYFIIPVFHNMKYLSVYEYVEKRFDKITKLFYSLTYLIINLVFNAVYLYVPAIAVTTVTGVSYWITLTVSGLLCSLYCVIGGLKAVIWTDVFQTVLMFSGIIIVTIVAYVDVGGLQNAWSVTFSGNLHQHFKLTEDFKNSYTVWNIFFYVVTYCFHTTVGSQASAQRFLCVKDCKTAKNAFLLGNILGMVLITIVLFTSVAIFSTLTKCNPLEQRNSSVKLPEQIYIYVAERLLRGMPGVLGLVLAGLISAALSSVSSKINALAANALEDYIIPLAPNLMKSEEKRLLLCRGLTAFFGVLTVVIGLIVPKIGGVIQTLFLVIGSLSGPLVGILLVAFFHRKACKKASKIAILVTLCLSVWLNFGSHYYHPHKSQFDHGEQFCPNTDNTTQFSDTINKYQATNESESNGLSIYGVGSFWYPAIVATLSIILTVALGRVFDEGNADIRLLSPIILTRDEREYVLNLGRHRFT